MVCLWAQDQTNPWHGECNAPFMRGAVTERQRGGAVTERQRGDEVTECVSRFANVLYAMSARDSSKLNVSAVVQSPLIQGATSTSMFTKREDNVVMLYREMVCTTTFIVGTYRLEYFTI